MCTVCPLTSCWRATDLSRPGSQVRSLVTTQGGAGSLTMEMGANRYQQAPGRTEQTCSLSQPFPRVPALSPGSERLTWGATPQQKNPLTGLAGLPWAILTSGLGDPVHTSLTNTADAALFLPRSFKKSVIPGPDPASDLRAGSSCGGA